MFLFKKKPVLLDCFTTSASAYEFSPPTRATKAFPKWWRELPIPEKTYKFDTPYDNTNMRGCLGLTDLYRRSVALPMWCDVDLWVAPIGNVDFGYQFADRMSSAETHDASQAAGFFNPTTTQHLKLISPWRFRTSENIQWAMIPATYNQEVGPYQLLPAIVDFKNTPATHLQLLLPRQQEVKFVHIAHNTPMYLYTPLTDRSVTLRTHLIGEHEFSRMSQASLTRNFRGRQMVKLRREASVAAEKSCPFSKIFTD